MPMENGSLDIKEHIEQMADPTCVITPGNKGSAANRTVYICDFCGFEGDRDSIITLKIRLQKPDGLEYQDVYSKELCAACNKKTIEGIIEVLKLEDPQVAKAFERNELMKQFNCQGSV